MEWNTVRRLVSSCRMGRNSQMSRNVLWYNIAVGLVCDSVAELSSRRDSNRGILMGVTLKYLSGVWFLWTPWRHVGDYRYSYSHFNFCNKRRWVVSFTHTGNLTPAEPSPVPTEQQTRCAPTQPVWALRKRESLFSFLGIVIQILGCPGKVLMNDKWGKGREELSKNLKKK